MAHQELPAALLEHLRGLSTCVLASAIETFGVRLPNVGFADSRVRCIFPEMPAIIGYAATARLRSSLPPLEGGTYYGRTDWWDSISKVPTPRIAVLQDMDDPPGLGAFVGEVHANALAALHCAGLITNGGVRDLPQVRSIPFSLFAGNVTVSHAYAHISGFGEPVEVGGLEIHPGDLLLADLHGVVSIPLKIARQLPEAADYIQCMRREIVGMCRSAEFTIEKLKAVGDSYGCIRQKEQAMDESPLKRGRS